MTELTPISATTFIGLTKDGPVSRKRLNEQVTITSDNSEGNGYKITDCEFEIFEFYTGAATFTMERCTSKSLDINTNVPIFTLKLIDCNIKELSITIKSEHPASSVYVEGSKTESTSLHFEGRFQKITAKSLSKVESISMEDVDIATGISFYSVSKAQIYWNNVTSNYCSMRSVSSIFLECNRVSIKTFSFDRPRGSHLVFNSCTSDQISINQGVDDNSVTLSGNGNYDFEYNTPEIAKNPLLPVSRFQLSNFYLPTSKRIKLLNLSIAELFIDGFENHGEVDISKCVVTSKFRISESNVRKIIFSKISIAEECSVSVLNSNLTDAVFTNFKWKKDYKLDETGQDFLPDLRESYRQLKANYLKNGNKIEALEFQKHELNMHYEILKNVKPKGWFTRDRGNYLIVLTNKLFSDFGQNIWKPLAWLLGGHITLFGILVLAQPELHIGFGYPHDWKVFWNGVNYYLQTLLPVHSSELKVGEAKVTILPAIDVPMRILSGYFIFYFISASRKYHQ